MRIKAAAAGLLAGLTLAACSSGVDNTAGTPTTYQDPQTRGAVGGVGIESQDIVSMTDQMMRDMLTNPQLTADGGTPPRVIIDDAYFENRSSQRIDKQLVVNRLRVGLSRASNGRMVFVGRQYADAVEKERQLKRDGVVDSATTGLTEATAGADYGRPARRSATARSPSRCSTWNTARSSGVGSTSSPRPRRTM